MFRIADGREQFYQWDLDRQVIVEDPSIVEVHFCNRTDDCSLVTEVVNGLANVPNIILQSNYDIRVFGYDGKATRFDEVFKVKARTKPTNYVYTEVEIKRYEDLEKHIDERLDKIAESGIIVDLTGYATEDYVDNAIAEIPEVDLSDYYTRTETDTLLADLDVAMSLEDDGEGNVTISNVDRTEEGWADLSDYYTKEETELLIEEALENIDIPEPEDVDLEPYAKKTDVPTKVSQLTNDSKFITLAEVPSLEGYATEQYVTNAINTAFAGIATAEGGAY